MNEGQQQGKQKEGSQKMSIARPERWEAIRETAHRICGMIQSPVWARVHFTGRSSYMGVVPPLHLFGQLTLSDSDLYGWIDGDLTSSPREGPDKESPCSTLYMGARPPTRPTTPSDESSPVPSITSSDGITMTLFPVPSVLSPIDNVSAVDLALSIGRSIGRSRLSDAHSHAPEFFDLRPDSFPLLVLTRFEGHVP
ncbi:hypothetical protein IAR50_005966 [Cryptococcus sp. DSM 104548]